MPVQIRRFGSQLGGNTDQRQHLYLADAVEWQQYSAKHGGNTRDHALWRHRRRTVLEVHGLCLYRLSIGARNEGSFTGWFLLYRRHDRAGDPARWCSGVALGNIG